MITGSEGRQNHTLLDLKKQQWAKEKEEIAKLDEMFSSVHSSSSTHHHQKIEQRTSIRTFYSNLDLSQTTRKNSRQHLYQQEQQQQQQQHHHNQQHNPPFSPNSDLLSPPEPLDTENMHALVPRSQALKPKARGHHVVDYMNNYIGDDGDDIGNEADFEDIGEAYIPLRRGSQYQHANGRPVLLNQRHNSTSEMSQMPGQRKYAYVELMPNTLQTAKGRMQRIRSPSLPVIRHRDYVVYHQQQGNKPAGKPTNATTQLVSVDGGVVGGGSNQQHRLNKSTKQPPPHQQQFPQQHHQQFPVAPPPLGCQEEDTSGYLSDSPKNIHTPNIWFNDGASQVESVTSAAESSSLMQGHTANSDVEYVTTRRGSQQQQQQQQHLVEYDEDGLVGVDPGNNSQGSKPYQGG
ncbi:uncharacterized protein LOC133336923, partial [Musca vetustissima]|uniref:uncharacterized protein LOC133336923 n=1 Tax=Musca vetustissima TaxID=27455 RepID=UPI002AB7C444